MTVAAVDRKAGPYLANGVQTSFAYDFKILLAEDLDVYASDVLVSPASYSVSGVGAEDGGNVTFTTAPASGTVVWIFGGLSVEQQTAIAPGGQIRSAGIEQALDYLTMLLWERIEVDERTPVLAKTIGTALRNLVWPHGQRKLLGWNADGSGLTLYEPATPGEPLGDPVLIDDYSNTVAQMRAQTDPGELGSESLPSSLAGEIERLRYRVAEISGMPYWYQTGTGIRALPLAGAALPAVASPGRLATLTDGLRGLYLEGATQWARSVPTVAAELWGANPAASADTNATAINAAITAVAAAGGGTVTLGPGVFSTQTIHLATGVHLQGAGMGRTTLSLAAMGATHRPVVRFGDAGDTAKGGVGRGAISNARLSHLTLDGNRALQTSNEFGHGVFIWGSDGNVVEHVAVTDVSGDGICIGYDSERQVGSHHNVIQHCEVWDVHSNRQGIAITWGNLNKILYNRVSDTIDLELDATYGECKGNLVYGNTGRTVSNGQTTILTSDLRISLAQLGTDISRYSVGNVIAANYCWAIECQYNSGVHIVHNTVVGSNNTQQRLLGLDALYNAVVSGNVLIANAPVATALQHILRTRAGQGLVVTDNLVNNGSLPFHNFLSTFASEPAAASHLFRGNVCTGTGDYRNGSSTSMATQTSTYKLTVAGGSPQVFTATLLDGPFLPLTFGSGGGLGHVLNIAVSFASGAGLWRLEVLPYGTVGKTTEPWDRTFVYTVDEIGGARAIEVYAAPLGGVAPTYTQVDFNSGGSIAVLFLRFHY